MNNIIHSTIIIFRDILNLNLISKRKKKTKMNNIFTKYYCISFMLTFIVIFEKTLADSKYVFLYV